MSDEHIVALYSVCWTEMESGWGSRPDGYSFHKNLQEAKDFISDVTKDQDLREYSSPSKPTLVEVSESLRDFVTKHGSVWLRSNDLDVYKTYDATSLFEKKRHK